MSITVTLPEVTACEATRCAYNQNQRCHAPAITIGDEANPMCDTFLPDDRHVSRTQEAGVGACKVDVCKHNVDRECHASSIRVELQGDDPDCATFEQKT